MQARVKSDARWNNISAFSGREYTKGEWRDVPAGCEAEAESNPFLELSSGKGKADKAPAAAATKGKGKADEKSGEGAASEGGQ